MVYAGLPNFFLVNPPKAVAVHYAFRMALLRENGLKAHLG